MPSTAEKQQRILPFFQFTTLSTKDKFGILVQRDRRLAGLGVLGRGVLFSCFHEEHLKEATQLYEVLIGCDSFEEFLDLCHQAREYVNEGLYVYAVSVAILHRQDCRGVSLPPVQEIFPDKFVPSETLFRAFKEVNLHPEDEEIIVDIVKTGNVKDPEYNLAYYREDIGINAHHWHWHLVYPATWRPEVVHRIKDRKGELFFYMHQQMCARYDAERLSNGMPPMVPFHNFHEPLEGYSSHLTSGINGMPYAFRPAGRTLKDMPEITVQDLERSRERLMQAINLGYVVDPNGLRTELDETHGIDILGAIVESSNDSANKIFYGSLHNWGHVIMSAIDDPDGRYKLNPGVMSDTATSLRDPIFYRWHRFIDDMFQEYKKSLSPYTSLLAFKGVKIQSVCIRANTADVVKTHMEKDLMDISHAFNFGRSGSVKVAYTHLNHEAFTYKIEVDNIGTKTRPATVRIFLGPKHDNLGNEIPIGHLRRLMIELDRFNTTLHPGHNTIERKSGDSSVTINKQYSYEQLRRGRSRREQSEYCSCGWPEHLLMPKGNDQGMKFHLFVMLTDAVRGEVGDHGATGLCTDAVSYCGAKDQLYPDRYPMGFPFDRDIKAETIKEWLQPNMFTSEVTIVHQHA